VRDSLVVRRRGNESNPELQTSCTAPSSSSMSTHAYAGGELWAPKRRNGFIEAGEEKMRSRVQCIAVQTVLVGGVLRRRRRQALRRPKSTPCLVLGRHTHLDLFPLTAFDASHESAAASRPSCSTGPSSFRGGDKDPVPGLSSGVSGPSFSVSPFISIPPIRPAA
jgi:hypothetical protein